MTDSYQKLFQKLEMAEPPVELEGKIIGVIRRRARRAAQFKLASSGFLFYFSGFLSIFAIKFIGAELAASGFSGYLSMLFSEGWAILPLWKEFSLALAESAPIWGIVLLCGAVFVLLASFKSTFGNQKIYYQFNFN